VQAAEDEHGRDFLRVSLQLHKWGVECRRREDRGAEGAEGVGCGRGWGGGCASFPEKFFDSGSQYGEFWCILDGIFLQFGCLFYTQNRCNLVPVPIFFFNFSLQKGPFSFSCILV